MGLAQGGGQLGLAQGRINIDVTQLAAAQQAVINASRQMTQAMNAISPSVDNAQRRINDLRKGFQQLAGAFGVSLGALGVAQFTRAIAAADQLATAYNRQRVAAVNLAGSQAELNDLLATYERVSGGSVSKVSALENVTKLLSVGFADSTAELERFATAIRGISIARNVSEDFVTQNLILELFSQRGQRLDQLGLQYEKVRAAADQLRAADHTLTREMAYQLAVLDQAERRFGTLVRTQEGQKTGLERLGDAWQDFRLAVGQVAGPGVNFLSDALANWLKDNTAAVYALGDALEFVKKHLQEVGHFFAPGIIGPYQFPTARAGSATTGSGGNAAAGLSVGEEQRALILDWWQQTRDIEREANRQRIEATRQYEEQRAQAIRQYEQTIAREAQDFAIGRARAEQDYTIGLQRFRRDSAEREARQVAELERNRQETQRDAAERRIELEADFQRRQQRAARDHAESILDAAGRLDALAISKQQREFAKRQRDEQEDFDDRLAKERANEAKRLDQAQRAFDRQLAEARAADEQRLVDMSADMALRQARENEDRALRLDRLAQDHNAQLEEQARQHELRLMQIADEEAESRAKLDDEFQKELAALGIRTQAYRDKMHEYETAAIEAFDNVWLHWLGALQGPAPLNPYVGPLGSPPRLNAPAVAPSSVTNTVNRGGNQITITIPIQAAPNQRPYDIADEVDRRLFYHLEQLGK